MKINKRVFYALSSLLILGYSVLSPFSKVSALDDKKNHAPFHTTKNLYLEDGPNSKMDITNYLVTTLFTSKDVYNRKIVWNCPAMTREQAYTSYKKAIANNSGWLITQRQGARNVQITSSKSQLYSSGSVNVYWSEVKPDEQTLYYYGDRINHSMYYFGASPLIRSSFRVLYLTYSYRDELVRISCDMSVGKVQTRISTDNPDLADYYLEKGEFDRISTFLNTFPYKLDKSIT